MAAAGTVDEVAADEEVDDRRETTEGHPLPVLCVGEIIEPQFAHSVSNEARPRQMAPPPGGIGDTN